MQPNTSPTIDKPPETNATPRPKHFNGVVKLMKNRTATMVCIPKPFSRALQWHAGDEVLITLNGNKLVLVSIASQMQQTSAAAVEDV